MAVFKIHRVREQAFQQFRWAAHTAGPSVVKPKDYEPGGEVEAASPYEAWTALNGTERPLRVGDLLESEGGDLRICKYVGFEPASWFVPEVKAAGEPVAAADSQAEPPRSA